MPSRFRLCWNGNTYWKLLPLSSISSKLKGWPVLLFTNRWFFTSQPAWFSNCVAFSRFWRSLPLPSEDGGW
ncbi:hypothetical protein D3C71_1637660 [compost metagenome]